MIKDLEDLQDKYNKLAREKRLLNNVRETLEDNLKETFESLKDE